MKNGEALVCAVIFRAVTDYRKQRFILSKFCKKFHEEIENGEKEYLNTYNEMIAEIAYLRRFFTEQNIYWDAINLDGKSILRRIDDQLERKVKA